MNPSASRHDDGDHGGRPDDAPDEVTALIVAGLDREAARRGAGLVTSHDHHGGTMEPLDQLAALGPLLGDVLAGIEPGDLGRPTPCAAFTVRGVLEHMAGGATAFAAAYRGEAPGAPPGGDPIEAVGHALADLVSSISAPGALERTVAAPFGALPGETFARFIVLDGLVHGWDMAVATGQDYAPPDELVGSVADFARQVLDPLRDGVAFGPALEPPPGASPIEALAAYTGRRVPGGNP